MAEKWTPAFGRYLRTLRERRGLSLQDVCSLSQAFTETLNKGYLSRCENGHQSLAFSKVIALSRIYEVHADVLLERLELDMELDRVGGAETEGKGYEELLQEGRTAFNRGFFWEAYGLHRDSIAAAPLTPVPPQYKGRAEQVACAHMNCAGAARALGREQYARHELCNAEASGHVGPKFQTALYIYLSQTHKASSDLPAAIRYGDKALAVALQFDDTTRLGFAYSNLAQLVYADRDLLQAATLFQKAHGAFQKVGYGFECARMLNNLAQVYFDLGRLRAARRSLGAAEELARSLGQHRARALGYILLGEIESRERNTDAASRRWKDAAEIARRLNDKTLRFKAEYFLFKQACETGDAPSARALQRRLRRLSVWIPRDTPELTDFRRLAVEKEPALSLSSRAAT
jgi:tetratricopeptide (TPR) repeat protein